MEDLMNKFIEYMKNYKNSSYNTTLAYKRDLKSFNYFLIESNITDINRIEKSDIDLYLARLHSTGKAVSTVSRNIAVLKAFFQYLYKIGIVNSNPVCDIQPPKIERKLPEILSIEEVETLLNQPNTNNLKGIRDKAMIEILYATGIRVSELICLKLSDLDLNSGYVKCSYNDKERNIPLGSYAIESIKLYIEKVRFAMIREPNEDILFVNCYGMPMTRQGFWKIIKSYAQKADIPENITPNILRHSFAAHLVSNGANLQSVQKMLGHTDISTTQIYVQVNKAKVKKTYLESHPRA